jgi:putative DNA primase/helicase
MPIEIFEQKDIATLESTLWSSGRDRAAEEARTPGTPDLVSQLQNDHGNACRLVALYGSDLRYCHAFKKWLVWDGRRWAVDDTGQSRRLAKETMLEFLRQAIGTHAGEKTEKFASSSLDSRRIASMLTMAEPDIFVRPTDLDKDPYLLNFTNGTVDLRTGLLKPHERKDFITRLVPYPYVQVASCPQWLAFLDQIMGGGPGTEEEAKERSRRLIAYLQRAFGYSLTGCTIEKAVFVLFGDGNNGKSTLLSTVRQLIEEYSMLLQVDTLMVRQESNNTQADLADLRGARFVQTSETEEGQCLAQGKLKRITQGMGKIKAARKYENPIEFPETHKLWMDTNRKPTIRDAKDKATFDRLHAIPFLVRIPKEKIDRDLPAKLLAGAEGILAWAVAGAQIWHRDGLGKPEEVAAAGTRWQSEMDQIGRFMSEMCVSGPSFSCQSSTLYTAYKIWAEKGREENIASQKIFASSLADREGIASTHLNTGTRYSGIGLRHNPGEGGTN